MARPRSLRPSPVAIKRRAERAVSATRPLAAPAQEAAADADQLDLIDGDEPAPLIPAGATTEEAVRLHAIYNARKMRLASLAEGLRLEIERGNLVQRTELTRAVTMIRDSGWREAQQITALTLARLSGLPTDARAQVRAAIDAELAGWGDRWRRAVLAAVGVERGADADQTGVQP